MIFFRFETSGSSSPPKFDGLAIVSSCSSWISWGQGGAAVGTRTPGWWWTLKPPSFAAWVHNLRRGVQ